MCAQARAIAARSGEVAATVAKGMWQRTRERGGAVNDSAAAGVVSERECQVKMSEYRTVVGGIPPVSHLPLRMNGPGLWKGDHVWQRGHSLPNVPIGGLAASDTCTQKQHRGRAGLTCPLGPSGSLLGPCEDVQYLWSVARRPALIRPMIASAESRILELSNLYAVVFFVPSRRRDLHCKSAGRMETSIGNDRSTVKAVSDQGILPVLYSSCVPARPANCRAQGFGKSPKRGDIKARSRQAQASRHHATPAVGDAMSVEMRFGSAWFSATAIYRYHLRWLPCHANVVGPFDLASSSSPSWWSQRTTLSLELEVEVFQRSCRYEVTTQCRMLMMTGLMKVSMIALSRTPILGFATTVDNRGGVVQYERARIHFVTIHLSQFSVDTEPQAQQPDP
ncbi:hypothetical protein BCV70DRAFT_221987 [Testicularia cyperi]|uniref:Uncharacterized protein n=1 Tax=Testicularia cyperi TaxID=1882483 RepID=A0A317XVS7_9BASI|nr:hypothetical protein BCV70DRAFT_221987 [Testicularia cyperi]